MGKIEAYKFLDSLLEGVPDGEEKRVELLIKKLGDHWIIKVLEETTKKAGGLEHEQDIFH